MKKVCKKCKIFISQEKCPICGNADFSDSWKGRIIIIKPKESEIANKLGITKEGAFAIKIK